MEAFQKLYNCDYITNSHKVISKIISLLKFYKLG